MLQHIKQFYGKSLGANDGDIGQVSDFYFDDKSWLIRYLIAATGPWLLERKVLLAPHAFGPHAFGRSEADPNLLRVNLTRKQIEDSPPIDAHRPVSRRYEIDYYRYYGWPVYWQESDAMGLNLPVFAAPSLAGENMGHFGPDQSEDQHLRSAKSVAGYKLQAADGSIGTVSDFVVDDRTWKIREVAVDIGHWYASKEILVLPENIQRISYEDSTVYVNLSREEIQKTQKHDVAQAEIPRL